MLEEMVRIAFMALALLRSIICLHPKDEPKYVHRAE